MKEKELTDEEIKNKYIAFHSDPANIQFNDAYFCSINSISLDHLRDVIRENPEEIGKAVKGREVTDNELSTLLGLLTRLCYEKAFKDIGFKVTNKVECIAKRQISPELKKYSEKPFFLLYALEKL